MYDLDPAYPENNGKRYVPDEGEAEIELTMEIVANFTKEYPNFIGLRRIAYGHRMQDFESLEAEAQRVTRLYNK